MSHSFQSITQSNNTQAQAAEREKTEHQCKAGNKFRFRKKK